MAVVHHIYHGVNCKCHICTPSLHYSHLYETVPEDVYVGNDTLKRYAEAKGITYDEAMSYLNECRHNEREVRNKLLSEIRQIGKKPVVGFWAYLLR